MDQSPPDVEQYGKSGKVAARAMIATFLSAGFSYLATQYETDDKELVTLLQIFTATAAIFCTELLLWLGNVFSPGNAESFRFSLGARWQIFAIGRRLSKDQYMSEESRADLSFIRDKYIKAIHTISAPKSK